MIRYVDTHAHPYFPQFDADRDSVYARMREANVQTIAVGTNLLTSRQAVQAAVDVPDVVLGATIGVHPNHAGEGFEPHLYEKLFTTHECSEGSPPLVVGVGECGLDYFRGADEAEKTLQKEVFALQIAFAVAHNLPLMLHVRPSKGSDDAHDDALDILTRAKKGGGVRLCGTAHFFTGSLAAAERYWALGFATSFPGVVTFAKECEDVVRACPAHLMLSETDAPYAAPVPYRGGRCEPAHVVEVVRTIARLRGEEEAAVARQLLDNAQRVFNVV